ncbi:MAG: PucR family transcriptional regulator [Actinomycetota bacterium]
MTTDRDVPAHDRPPLTELRRGITVEEVLDIACLRGARVLAGGEGLHRIVERLNVMEVPDILPWVKPREFLLTTAYPLREAPPGDLTALVQELDDRGLSGLGIKLGRYINEVPSQMLAEAEGLAFPLVQLPDDVAFDDILNQVLANILNRESANLARSQELHRTLIALVLAGGDLPELAREVAGLLGSPTVILDLEGTVLASSGHPDIPELLKTAGVVRSNGLTLTSGPCALESPEGAPRYAHAPVLAGGRWNASIVAFEADRQLRDDDMVALEIAATVTALAITKARAVSAVESKFQAEFLHDLFNRRVTDPEEADARATQFGWKLDRALTVIVGEFQDPYPGRADESRLGGLSRSLASLLHRSDRHAAVVTLSKEVVAITGVDVPLADIDAHRQMIRKILHELTAIERRTRIGVSRPVAGAMKVAEGYWQARKALDVGETLMIENGLVHFDDLGAFRVLSLIRDEAEVDAFVREVLGDLVEPHQRSEEMLETLEELFDHNLNVAETARAMHYHYNTMRYRIERLQEALGPFTTDANLRFSLQLALRLQRMCFA